MYFQIQFKSLINSINNKFFVLFLALLSLFLFESSVQARQVKLEWDGNSESDLSHCNPPLK
jgi:hypothetical protein